MAGVIARVVNRVSTRPTLGSALFANSDAIYDFSIGGIPFLSASSKEHPSRRQTAPYRKDQIDQSNDPGEQSLVFWWLRAQRSFHSGAGITYEEPDPNVPSIATRFASSQGIDTFTTQGQASLLRATTQAGSSATSGQKVIGGTDGAGNDCVLWANGTALSRCSTGFVITAVTWGGTGTILSLTQDGTNYYAADSVGIWQGTLAGGAGAKIWNTGSSNVVTAWVKMRLMAGIGPTLYELTGASGAPTLPAAGAAGNLYTHPNPNWQWTAIAESPSAIYAAGYVGNQSAIYKLGLTASSGSVPSLQYPTVAAELPRGEYVTALKGVLGNYLAIGTNKGVRIATVDDNGDLQYGPLNVTTSAPVYDFTAKDRFIYFTLTNGMPDGKSGLGWIDLGTQVDFRRWAWATNLQSHVTGTVRGVAPMGVSGRLAFCVDAQGLYVEQASNLEPTGTLTTGYIRFHTLEPKLFKFLRMRTRPLKGTISATVTTPAGGVTTIATYSDAGSTDLPEAQFPAIGPQEYVTLTFSFTRDSVDATTGPTFVSYQIKALPSQKNQRFIQLALMCYDHETDRQNTASGYDGWAATRLQALESLEEGRDVVTFQDLRVNGLAQRSVVIDEIDFIEVDPPGQDGIGGVLLVTLRTVD